MHLQRGKVVNVNDAQKNHSDRLAHAAWFGEDAGPRDPARSPSLWRYGGERLVCMPI